MMPVSVLILTKNEEIDLPGCIESVGWSDDIHVFDSYSTDRTVDIARFHHASIHQRQFDNYAAQRNASLHDVHYKNDWVLILDADERITKDLTDEISRALQTVTDEVAAFRMLRRDYLWGTWLKHAQLSPRYVRLVRLGRVRYVREVNEVPIVDGKIIDLQNGFDHYPFSKGISQWIQKHNRYSSMEAQLIASEAEVCGQPSIVKAFLEKDFTRRRYHQKALFFKLPFRPLLKWFYMMFVRCAFLDGRAGITYAFLQSIYEYFIVLKEREQARSKTEEKENI